MSLQKEIEVWRKKYKAHRRRVALENFLKKDLGTLYDLFLAWIPSEIRPVWEKEKLLNEFSEKLRFNFNSLTFSWFYVLWEIWFNI